MRGEHAENRASENTDNVTNHNSVRAQQYARVHVRDRYQYDSAIISCRLVRILSFSVPFWLLDLLSR